MASDKTALGDRMKRYEEATRVVLPRRTYTIIRIDGKAFHTYCRGFEKPYDPKISLCLVQAACSIAASVQGVLFGYCQSDEASFVLMDFDRISTEAYFDNNLQKLVSISASLATATFNYWMPILGSPHNRLAHFDSRAFTIPDPTEVANYFIWRQRDATRNSVSSAAQSVYSAKELHGKSINQQQELLHQKGINWNDYPVSFKRGTIITNNGWGWGPEDPPIFTQNQEYLKAKIRTYEDCE